MFKMFLTLLYARQIVLFSSLQPRKTLRPPDTTGAHNNQNLLVLEMQRKPNFSRKLAAEAGQHRKFRNRRPEKFKKNKEGGGGGKTLKCHGTNALALENSYRYTVAFFGHILGDTGD